MKSVSIYALTRNQTGDQLQKMEHQLSGRDSFLKIRDWEIGSMRALVNQLEAHMEEVPLLRFFLFVSDSAAWKRIRPSSD